MSNISKKNIAFLSGVSDDGQITVLQFQMNGTLSYAVNGSINIEKFLQSNLYNRYAIMLDTLEDQKITLDQFDAVFNQIADADTHKKTLVKADELYNTYSGKMPFFNPPSNIKRTTRDNIYKLLQGIKKLHVPKTVRIQPKSPSDIYDAIKKENFEFPVIFRKAGDHGGISTIRIDDTTEQFYAFPLDGKDYYLTQFIEYVNSDGIYSKYRLVVVDGEVFLRHAIFGKKWMMHAGSQLEKKEGALIKQPAADSFLTKIKPSIQPIVTEIHHRLGLDYFGIDCHIDDNMNILAFEVNSNMNIFIDLEDSIFKKNMEHAHQALVKMLTKPKV